PPQQRVDGRRLDERDVHRGDQDAANARPIGDRQRRLHRGQLSVLGVRVFDEPARQAEPFQLGHEASSSERPTTRTSSTPPSSSARASLERNGLPVPGTRSRAFGCPIRVDRPAARITPGTIWPFYGSADGAYWNRGSPEWADLTGYSARARFLTSPAELPKLA